MGGGWSGVVVQLITLSLPTGVEVELGCDNNDMVINVSIELLLLIST